jgi:hypothetical protein
MKLSQLKQQYKDSMQGGVGDSTNVDNVCYKQLAIGILVEKEHTNDVMKAMEIAIDHLTETEDYYSTLIKLGLADEKPAINLHKKLYASNVITEEDNLNIAQEEVKALLKSYDGKNVPDDEIHDIADKNKVSVHDLESYIYSLASKYLNNK